jgi:hypothetical protein
VPLTVEAYAQIMAELFAAGPGDARAVVLARHALDEAAWEAADTEWQARLSAAMDAPGDAVAPLISAYAAAYESAQRALGPPVSLEGFAAVTGALHAGADLSAALAEAGIPLQAYVRGSEHWTPRLAREPDLAARFEALVRERRGRGPT